MAIAIPVKWVDTPGYVFNNKTRGPCCDDKILRQLSSDPIWVDIYHTDENTESFRCQTTKEWIIPDVEVHDIMGYLSDTYIQEYLRVVRKINAMVVGQPNNNLPEDVNEVVV